MAVNKNVIIAWRKLPYLIWALCTSPITFLKSLYEETLKKEVLDDILNDTGNNPEILGNQLLPVEEYLLNFFKTHDNEDY